MKNVIRWDPRSYINIWVVDEICSNNGCGVAGYAYFPSSHGSNVDGIVLEDNYVGSSAANTSVLVHETSPDRARGSTKFEESLQLLQES